MAALIGNAVIGFGGGPTAVVNQSLVGAIETARERPEIEHLLGMRFGYYGVLKEQFVDLFQESPDTLEAVARTPSAALGSTRGKPSEEDCRAMFEVLRRHNVRYFLYIGGNDTAESTAIINRNARAAQYEMRCIHIPKTVDNDLLVTDHCPGYGSAARYVACAFMGDDLDNASLPGVKIDVCMGRNAGYLTAASALARTSEDGGPHLIYLPEVPVTCDQIVAEIVAVYQRLGRCLVAVSEGIVAADRPGKKGLMTFAEIALAEVEARAPERAEHDNIQLSGSGTLGDWLAGHVRKHMETELKIEKPRVRADTLGYAQRSFPGVVSEVDAAEARMCGRKAVEFATAADQDGSVVMKRTGNGEDYGVEYKRTDLEEVEHHTKSMEEHYILAEERFVTPAFLDYVRPLVGPLPAIARLAGKPFAQGG